MARQNIQFRGLRHTPSDITGQDGDLLECVNLIHENGEMKPIEMPEKTAYRGFYSNDTLVAVHNVTDGKKFVYAVYNGVITHIHIKNENGDDDDVLINDSVGRGIPNEEIKWAETIGNTLIIGTDKSIHYALYKNGQYKWLGDKLPQPVFEFDLNRFDNTDVGYWLDEWEPKTTTMTECGDMVDGGGVALQATIKDDSDLSNSESVGFANTSDENKKLFRDGVRAQVATLLGTARKNNIFVFPFMMRYAVRMYDGNYAMHSAPILMIPSSLVCPILAYLVYLDFDAHTDSEGYRYTLTNTDVRFRGLELLLKCKGFCDENGVFFDASDWNDVIKGVDLFMSSPIYSYNEAVWDDIHNVPDSFYVYNRKQYDATTGTFIDYPRWRDYGVCYSQNNRIEWWDIYKYTSVGAIDLLDTAASVSGNSYLYRKIPLPTYSEAEMTEKIKNTSLFYRVKHYDFNEVNEEWDDYKRFGQEVEFGTLDRLETLPILPDDYVSRCRMVGSVNYNYNQRLVLGNISLQAPLWYQDAKKFPKLDNYDAKLWFKIEKPEKTIWVEWQWEDLGEYDFGHYLFYPDPDCKEVVLNIQNETWRSIPMHEHTGLHGAYALMPELQSLYEARTTFTSPDISAEPDWDSRYYSMPNTIAMSSVANPFHFPATNFKDIGRTKVVGIAANVLDVSSGQWGQYPLYVFCSDGIIAVMIDGEGKMGGIQAVSADVLREPHGLSQPTLIQTNQMLVFLTQRGVMAIAGTRINCISEAMNGRHFNPMQELDGVDYHVGAFQNLITRASEGTSFQLFADSGFLGYDYAHNRVLLLRPDREYQYVLSLNTMLWSKEIIYTNLPSFQLDLVPGNTLPEQRSNALLDVVPIHAVVNNYTELYLQDTDGYLYKTMDVQGENSVKQIYQYGYLVSRPIRFGTDEYKTIVRALHRYTHYARMSFVKMALYGSRDGVKYGRINTLRGMSYQYFIFVVYTYLKPNERYSYMTVDFETRLTNKLR